MQGGAIFVEKNCVSKQFNANIAVLLSFSCLYIIFPKHYKKTKQNTLFLLFFV